MNYTQLNKYFCNLFNHELPFSEGDIQTTEQTHSIEKSKFKYDFETRYSTHLQATGKVSDEDYELLFSALDNEPVNYIVCLIVKVKNHFLIFIFDVDLTKMISVFSLNRWKELTKNS